MMLNIGVIIVVQLLSHVWLFATPWSEACQASLSFTISQSLFRLMSLKLMRPSNHLVLCCPFLLPPSIFPKIRVFSNESVLRIRWPKYWSFSSASVLPMNIQGWFPLELTGLILQSTGFSRVFSNTRVQKHQFFGAQPSLWCNSHPYMTTGKTIALTRWTFLGKVMSLLFNMLSRFVIAFLLQSSSFQFSHSVVSNSLRPYELQHTRPPCPSPIPGVHPNPRPLSRWCHPAISSSVVPFSSCPQSFPASGSFPMSQLFTSGGQSIGVSASQHQSLQWTPRTYLL